MTLPWFKFYGSEYLSDPKILSLSACERSCWVTILCLAGMNEGEIKYLSEQRLMTLAGVDFTRDEWQETEGVLLKFQKLGMITLSNEVVTVCNWSKRQRSEAYDRVKRYREKQQSNANVTNKVEKIREDKRRIDKNINKKGLEFLKQKKEELIKKKSI